jgi:hypothetical protein
VLELRRSSAPLLYLSLYCSYRGEANLNLDLGPSVSYCNLRTGNWNLAPAARDVPKRPEIGCPSLIPPRNSQQPRVLVFTLVEAPLLAWAIQIDS